MTNYYDVLGVTQNAKPEVIRAAYKALAQIYHPDKYDGDKDYAEAEIKRINEAFQILSDTEKRKAYDASKGKYEPSQEDEPDIPESAFNSDAWLLATEYNSDLQTIADNLRKISQKLSLTYQAYLLETKNFKNAKALAEQFEVEFLTSFFGSNNYLRHFGKLLIFAKERNAALELNKVVNVLGNDLQPLEIKDKIITKFKLSRVLFFQADDKSINWGTGFIDIIGYGDHAVIILPGDSASVTVYSDDEAKKIYEDHLKTSLFQRKFESYALIFIVILFIVGFLASLY